MILIADSGSTKTDWVLLDNNEAMTFVQTAGFNPYYSDPQDLSTIVREHVTKKVHAEDIHQIVFYGSGCSTESKQEIVRSVLVQFFPNASIEVYHDLLGSARSVLQHNPGIACILGTGSNSCKYDGTEILENIPSVGYFFGDEGSGTDFGKRLINHYLRDSLPANIKDSLEADYELTFEKAMDAIYNQPMPNRFFASFSPFITKHIDEPLITEIVKNSFRDFFRFQITRYSNYKEGELSFVGSIAFHYQLILGEIAAEFGLTVNNILPNPVEGLITYHRNPEKEISAE